MATGERSALTTTGGTGMKPTPEEENSLLGTEGLLLRLMGFWRWDGPVVGKCTDLLACLTLASVAFLPTGAVLKLCMDIPKDLEEATLCGFVFIFNVGCIIKAVCFIGERSTLQIFIKMLSDMRKQYGVNDRSEKIRHYYQRLSDLLFLYWQMILVPALIYWSAAPLIFSTFMDHSEESPHSNRQLPMPVWLPTDIHSTPTYEVLYAAHVCGIAAVGESVSSINILFCRQMLMIVAELGVLNENVSAIEKSEMETTVSKLRDSGYKKTLDNDSLQYSDTIQQKIPTDITTDEKIYIQLTTNVHHHQEILRLISLLEKIMNISVFIMLFINMANFCASLFITAVLLQRDGSWTRALKALSMIPYLLTETALFCLIGNKVTEQSERLTHSALSCGWVDCDARFKRSFLVFVTSTIRPLEITVGKTSKLSKEMLVQVLNASYGLLNLIYHFHSAE